MTLTALADRMCCGTSDAGYVVDRMEIQGLVARRPHPADRRAELLFLTDAGRSCRGSVLAALSDQAPVDALTDAEKHTLTGLLRKATA